MYAMHVLCSVPIRPNLELKPLPRQLLGSLTLNIAQTVISVQCFKSIIDKIAKKFCCFPLKQLVLYKYYKCNNYMSNVPSNYYYKKCEIYRLDFIPPPHPTLTSFHSLFANAKFIA
jgi:hypothetical protein